MPFIIKCERANKLRRTYFLCRNGGETMKYECLRLEERRIIEAMYAEGAKPGEIAKRVGKCQATIYRELERGKTGETDSRFRQGYSAAQAPALAKRPCGAGAGRGRNDGAGLDKPYRNRNAVYSRLRDTRLCPRPRRVRPLAPRNRVNPRPPRRGLFFALFLFALLTY